MQRASSLRATLSVSVEFSLILLSVHVRLSWIRHTCISLRAASLSSIPYTFTCVFLFFLEFSSFSSDLIRDLLHCSTPLFYLFYPPTLMHSDNLKSFVDNVVHTHDMDPGFEPANVSLWGAASSPSAVDPRRWHFGSCGLYVLSIGSSGVFTPWPNRPFPFGQSFFFTIGKIGKQWRRIGIFTKLNFLATPPHNDMVDFNGIKIKFAPLYEILNTLLIGSYQAELHSMNSSILT